MMLLCKQNFKGSTSVVLNLGSIAPQGFGESISKGSVSQFQGLGSLVYLTPMFRMMIFILTLFLCESHVSLFSGSMNA